jgi:hypothetical protein
MRRKPRKQEWITREVLPLDKMKVRARDALPPSYDDKGKAIWPENYEAWCTHCHDWLWRGLFHGRKQPCRYCKECLKKVRANVKQHRPVNHGGMYTHAIRCNSTGIVYRFSIMDNELPEDYTVIYKTRGGEMLPRKFWREKIYAKPDPDI